MALRRGTPEFPDDVALEPDPGSGRTLPAPGAPVVDAEDEPLPIGVEPWSGDDMPLGTASSHDLHAPLDDAPTADDARAVDRLVDSLPGLDATFADLVVGVATSDAFRRRRGEEK